jgi:6,7-dimethyl-8-ribityllumazine synthase
MAKRQSKKTAGAARSGGGLKVGGGGDPLPPVAIIVSRYNASITSELVMGATREYVERGGLVENLSVYGAPGAYELPQLALFAADSDRFAGVVALGCVIKGETRHDRYISEAVSHGLMNVTLTTGVPCAFGLLTVDKPQQAKDRAGGSKGNKGAEAMGAVLETIATVRHIFEGTDEGAVVVSKPGKPDKAKKSSAKAGVKKAGAKK